MGNVNVEIYISQFVTFFEKNPNDLIDLIGAINKEEFYDLVKDQCEKNDQSGQDVALTQDQIIDIVIKLKKIEKTNSKMMVIVDKVFQHTKYGLIGLN